jgi:hypothetical protein
MMFSLAQGVPLMTTGMAGHRRSKKPGTPTLRARHHDNARGHAENRIRNTTDPVEQLKAAYGYLLAAAKRAQHRDPATNTAPLVDAQRALMAAGDELIK